MSWTTRRRTSQLLIDGEAVKIADHPAVTENLDGFATSIEFQLLDRPDPVPPEDTPVELRWVDLATEEYLPLFGGYLLGRSVDSSPHAMIFRAVDELAKFSAVRTTNDLNLTGMTDGEAWETIAGVCDVDFDPADIVDTGYVLGERAPVYWKVGATGVSIIQELDRVFGCKTMTVLNNRVIRIAYGRYASTSDIQVSYDKATSADFWRNHKDTGDSDQVQSIWEVQGATVPCGDDNECSCLIWAKSIGTTPKKGKKIQAVPTGTFQSDLIQDEVLAQEVSRRMMRWYNRVPILLTAEVETDPNIHPGSVIGIQDPTYGIGDATEKAYVCLTVDKRGPRMTITAVGGSAGSAGTTTSGVEQRCNETNLDLDWDGTWSPPSFTFPPLGSWGAWGGFGFGSGNDWDDYGSTSSGVTLGFIWVNDPANSPGYDWDISGANISSSDFRNGTAFTDATIPERSPGIPKNYSASFDWTIGATGASGIDIFAEDSVDPDAIHWWFFTESSGTPDAFFWTGCNYLALCTGDFHDFGTFTPGSTLNLTVEWNADTFEYTVSMTGAGTFVLTSDAPPIANPVRIGAIAGGGGAGTTISVENLVIEVLE